MHSAIPVQSEHAFALNPEPTEDVLSDGGPNIIKGRQGIAIGSKRVEFRKEISFLSLSRLLDEAIDDGIEGFARLTQRGELLLRWPVNEHRCKFCHSCILCSPCR